jgi:hypothetical protein
VWKKQAGDSEQGRGDGIPGAWLFIIAEIRYFHLSNNKNVKMSSISFSAVFNH